MTGYALHPEAFIDLDEIREYIAEDNLDAADRVIDDILDAVAGLVPFPNQGHRRPVFVASVFRQPANVVTMHAANINI